MSLEDSVVALTAAVVELTASLRQGKVAEVAPVKVSAKEAKPEKVEPTKTAAVKGNGAGEGPSYDDAKSAIIALSGAKGRDTVVKVLAEAQKGAAKLPEVKPENFAKLIELANQAAKA